MAFTRPSDELDRLSVLYWREAAGEGGFGPLRLHGFAMDVADFLARLERDNVPGGNWGRLYDIWLARATCHASQAACLAQSRGE